MSDDSKRRRGLESAVSILLVVVLVFIGAGVLLRQFGAGVQRFGIGGGVYREGESVESGKSSPGGVSLSSYSPTGYEAVSGMEVFGADSLYEKINGKAPFYTEVGFERLFAQRFVSVEDSSLWMEFFVFDMGGAANAFSVYSRQRRSDADILPICGPSFGYGTGNGIYFVHGRYYVEMVGSAESGRLIEAMTEAAESFKSKVQVEEAGGLEMLERLAIDGQVPGSVQLYLKDAFGFSGLSDVFTCRYLIDGEEVTGFMSRKESAAAAERAAGSYRSFIMENGAEKTEADDKRLGSAVFDFYGTFEIIVAVDEFVVGVHEAPDKRRAERVAVRVIEAVAAESKDK